MNLDRINTKIDQLKERLESLEAERENILKLEEQRERFIGKYWILQDIGPDFPENVYIRVFAVEYDGPNDIICLAGPGFYGNFGDEPAECFSYFSAENIIPVPRDGWEEFMKCCREITEKEFNQALEDVNKNMKQAFDDFSLEEEPEEGEEVEEPEKEEE